MVSITPSLVENPPAEIQMGSNGNTGRFPPRTRRKCTKEVSAGDEGRGVEVGIGGGLVTCIEDFFRLELCEALQGRRIHGSKDGYDVSEMQQG